MKFQLVLAALVGLVASASFYPPISSADLADHAIGQDGQAGQQPAQSPAQMFKSGSEFNDILSRQPRYLRVDNVTVVNATSMAYGAFMFGSIALGVLSVLNDAALSVAKHKRVARRNRKKLRKNFQNDVIIDESDDETVDDNMDLDDESEYARYEQEVREYKKKYQEYLDQYSEWAKAYGQDPTPPEGSYPSGPPGPGFSKRYFLIFKNPQKIFLSSFYRLTLPKYVKAEVHYVRPHRGWLLKQPLKRPFFHGSQRFVCWLILISSVSIFILILKKQFLEYLGLKKDVLHPYGSSRLGLNLGLSCLGFQTSKIP